MSFLVVTSDGVVLVESEPTPDVLDLIAAEPRTSIAVPGPGGVRVAFSETAMLQGKNANVMMTLFCRNHGVLGAREAIFGRVALMCEMPDANRLAMPDWVADELRALRPHLTSSEIVAPVLALS